MSQSELASKLGVTFQQLQKYEKGANRISASKLFEIAQTLQVSVADLFEDVAAAYPGMESVSPLSRIDIQMASQLSQLPPGRLKGHLRSLIDALTHAPDQA